MPDNRNEKPGKTSSTQRTPTAGIRRGSPRDESSRPNRRPAQSTARGSISNAGSPRGPLSRDQKSNDPIRRGQPSKRPQSRRIDDTKKSLNVSGGRNNDNQSSVHMEPVSQDKAKSSIRHIDHIRNVNRKKTLMRAFFLWVVVLLFMVVAAAAILYVTDYVSPKPNYAFVTQGTIEHTISASALIIRDETAYASTTEGSLVTLALEGSRVSKSQELAMVIPDAAAATTDSLSNVQMQIVERQRELLKAGDGAGAQVIYTESDTSILPIINMIRHDAIYGNLSNLVSYSSSIQVLMDKRDFDLQSVSFSDEQLSTLILQKTTLENTLSANASVFRAEVPGIVSYKLDGLEGKLSSASVETITPEQLDGFLAASSGTMLSSLQIAANMNAFRICQNAEQYFAMVVEGYSITDLPLNSSVDIRVTAEGIIIPDCKIVRSVQSTNGVFIILHTTSSVERLLDRRTVEVELIRKSTTGLRVPVSSLLNPDYTTGYSQMMYNASGYARLMTVQVIDHDREYAIVEPAEGFDIPNDSTIIITNPDTISEGEKVEQ